MVSWRGIYFILTLFWGSFFGSIFMLGPFLPLMFINPSWYRWINNHLVATWLTLPVALLETMFGVKVIITGDAFIPGERSVIIMNHRTRMDWMFLWNCLMRYSYLRLEKICLKASLKSVPGFGWAMQAAAYIFIHRKWKDDKCHFEDMIDYFCDIHEPLQLLIFPEGTDLTENSTARSNEFAEKNGLQKYEYVLHPRTTGFTFVVDRLREAEGERALGYRAGASGQRRGRAVTASPPAFCTVLPRPGLVYSRCVCVLQSCARYPVVPVPFVEKTIFSPSNQATLLKMNWQYEHGIVPGLCSVSLSYTSSPPPHHTALIT
ncbi:lysocardiolipin acyltransferase 1 isoform X2 [Hippopotamus amphibius kiboko]|uniref:lysocardiolipin acyltransferase 1 isoform X2 n=1 Tax=Hippopotamus amphibius kiboko TaxID=575201 RepID=UPI002594BC42|nr:lysocardiolipin acyltransferase 1 isoform X2 [Hippopotamus amphibius kiboko]